MSKQKIKYEQSAMAVVLYENKILCTLEEIYGKSVLSLPKGHVETGETVLETAIRECFEETDIILTSEEAVKELKPYSYSFKTPDGHQICKSLNPVLFRLSKEQSPRAKEKRILEVKFMDVNAFINECPYDNVVNLVKTCL